MKPHAVSIAVGLITDAASRKLLMEIEIVLSDGQVVCQTIPANRMVRIDLETLLPKQSEADEDDSCGVV